ncbi:hypothetical protein DQ04_03751050 [Trypanosoma grayi]|uniref:hypothetical protein n=1 Tax=Trypanosoma grayi TaxID=71804 RepID=UPI0004F406AC|nr:hypothetical protein DQ04_03751050 [Trypanosoma grayi]KEG10402.1 hypothetical protein DQ04_03751050 [Trypanosoma grayi]
MLNEGQWRIVGTYQWRPLYQEYSNLEEKDLCEDEVPLNDIPIILYDTRQEDRGMLAPRYIATKVSVPQASVSNVKVRSGPAQLSNASTVPAVPLDPAVNCGVTPSTSGSSLHTKKIPFVVATTLPQPMHTIFVLPFVILLADIAVTAAGLNTVPSSPTLVALSCLLVLAPDVAAIALIFKRGRFSSTAATHVALWPCVALIFLFPFVSMIFVVHVFLRLILLLFIYRLRVSTHTTYFTFQ